MTRSPCLTHDVRSLSKCLRRSPHSHERSVPSVVDANLGFAEMRADVEPAAVAGDDVVIVEVDVVVFSLRRPISRQRELGAKTEDVAGPVFRHPKAVGEGTGRVEALPAA